MNRTVTITSKNHEHQHTYGGSICWSDFCTDYEGTRNIADRIAADWKFDEKCRKNLISRQYTENFRPFGGQFTH